MLSKNLSKKGLPIQAAIKNKNKKTIQQLIFQKLGLPKEIGEKYPFELSGGMMRRVLIATALGNQPKLMIADEPTPGLDQEILQEIIGQMKELVTSDKGMIFITHDIQIALQIADKIVVFKEGKAIETAKVEQFSGQGEKLSHPYTQALWNALPENNFNAPSLVSLPEHEAEEKEKQLVKKIDILEVKGLTYHYPNSSLLFQNLELTIEPGEIVGLYGPSGCGKSTMAQIISGYIKPIKGDILIGNKPISRSKFNPVQLIWQHSEEAINPRWRMRQILDEVEEVQIDLISALGLKKEWLSRWPSELSGGELQRFSLFRALSSDIKYLIADEITTMLDAITQAQIWNVLIKVAKARNIGILAISHDYKLLEKVSDRIVEFNNCINR